jgi:hypothetical protein
LQVLVSRDSDVESFAEYYKVCAPPPQSRSGAPLGG